MPEAVEPNALYSVDDIGRLLRLKPGSVRALIRKGQLPAKRIGRRYWIAGFVLLALAGELEKK